MSTRLQKATTTVKIVTAISVGYVVDKIIKENCPNEKLRQKAAIFVTSLTLGGLMAAKSERFAEVMLDETVKAWSNQEDETEPKSE